MKVSLIKNRFFALIPEFEIWGIFGRVYLTLTWLLWSIDIDFY